MEYYTLDTYIEALRRAGLLLKADAAGCGAEKVKGLTYDSRQVEEGTLFICKGAAFREEYLKATVKSGAMAYAAEKDYGLEGFPCLITSDIRKAMPLLADRFFCTPQNDLTITAFGGTKGKSTSAYYMKAVVDDYMRAEGKAESAILSTIDNYDGVVREESHMTTPESVELHRHFRNAVDSGISWLEMEVSSQALKYDRVDGIRFDAAVFLNISEDHISPSEHKDFEDYFTSKMKMFAQTDKAIVNLDSDLTGRILEYAKASGSCHTFSLKDPQADFYGYDLKKTQKGISFRARCADFDEDFSISMPGMFNVENAMGVIAAAYLQGIPVEYIRSGLARARSSGRMELFSNRDKSIIAIVDYAHNKLSFEKIFDAAAREYPGRKIVSVFGCTGGKGLDRRPLMGAVAAQYSCRVYLTTDDPGPEDPLDICAQVKPVIEQSGCPCEIIEDRGLAIHKAVFDCHEPTLLLVLGKGNDSTQKICGKLAPYKTDEFYVKRYLEEYDEAPFHAGCFHRGASDGEKK